MLGGSGPGPDDFASLNVTRGSAPCSASVLVGEICSRSPALSWNWSLASAFGMMYDMLVPSLRYGTR